MNILKKLLLKRKIKKAFKPYHKGKKTFLQCQIDALIATLGQPFEKVK